MPAFLSPFKRGVLLTVKVSPGSSREAFGEAVSLGDGKGEALVVALRAPPVDGKANKALIAFVAEAMGVRKSAVTLQSGETNRVKRLEIEGDPAALQALIESFLPH